MFRVCAGKYCGCGVLSLCLFLSFSGCGTTSSGPSVSGQNPPALSSGLSDKSVTPEALAALLPPDGAAESWKRSGEARTFGPDNLWEYIDGGAEGYLVYNFQAVATADYDFAGGEFQAVVDIYRMADRLCGFGIYASERAPDAARLDIGSEGYLSENALHFWQGPYYVKVTTFETGRGENLEVLARAAAARLDAAAGMPEELSVFPAEGLIEGSQRYMARDVLGQSALKNGFSAEYEIGETGFKLFFILHQDVDSANESFGVYREFMQQYGRNLQEHTGEEFPLFTAEDPYYGTVVAMQSGKVVLGILGLDDPELVNQYLKLMAEKLSLQGLA